MNKNLSKSAYKLALAAICALTSSLGHAAASSVPAGGGQLSYKWGLSDTQGRRYEMEDKHKIVSPYEDNPEQAFFGVYDGHGGVGPATYAERALDKNIAAYGLVQGFERTDADLAQYPNVKGGATAVVAVIEEQRDASLKLSFAWAGDSRGVLVNKAGEVVYATIDHKPEDPAEKARIEAAGGFISRDRSDSPWRVDGILGVARAIGDKDFGNKVPATPDVKEIRLNQDAAYIILACDGLWDEVSNEEAARVVTEVFARGDSSLPVDRVIEGTSKHEEGNSDIAIKAARALRNEAYTRGSTDNISVLVVKLDWAAVPAPSVRKSTGPSAAVTPDNLSKGLDDILSRAAMSASNNVALNGAVELLKNAQALLSNELVDPALRDLDAILKHPGSREMIDRIEKRKLKDEIDRIVSSVDLFAEGSLSNELNKFLAQRGVTASGNANVDKVVRSLQSANFFAGEDDISRALDLIDGARELAGELTVDVAVGQQSLGDMIRDIIRQ